MLSQSAFEGLKLRVEDFQVDILSVLKKESEQIDERKEKKRKEFLSPAIMSITLS